MASLLRRLRPIFSSGQSIMLAANSEVDGLEVDGLEVEASDIRVRAIQRNSWIQPAEDESASTTRANIRKQ